MPLTPSQAAEAAVLYAAGDSTVSLARRYDVDPSAVRRALRAAGVRMRSRAAAAALALCSRRRPHPTAGRPRTAEERARISEGRRRLSRRRPS